jgi:hypothetical protein
VKVTVAIAVSEREALCDWFDALDITCLSVSQCEIKDPLANWAITKLIYEFELADAREAMLVKLTWGGGSDVRVINSEEELIRIFGS